MISLRRLAEPEILQTKKADWDRAFASRRAQNPQAKAWNSQYAHDEIKRRLEAMSCHKCFYCEQGVKANSQVDHYIEVAERPDLAHEWTNLYLSCPDCNSGKLKNTVIPAKNCIDPCDSSVNPEEHLAFSKEFIKPHNKSSLGDQTIRKYGLDRPELDAERVRRLLCFVETQNEILRGMNSEGRKTMSDEELGLLRSFAQPDAPFSLMFRCYLQRDGL